MSEAVSVPREEYEELKFFKKLVENNLSDELSENDMKTIAKAQKSRLLTEKEARKQYPGFFC
jgi:hypothetical protein